jgi:nucleotide-binding universal stress UspA family protein
MIERILSPTDGSETAEGAVDFARDIALAEDAEVIVLEVVHTEQYGDTTDYDPIPELRAQAEKDVDGEVAELTAAGVRAKGVVIEGAEVASTIIGQIEQQHADVVVMGTHGRTGLARAFIGSVADRVIRKSHVPVLVVPKR